MVKRACIFFIYLYYCQTWWNKSISNGWRFSSGLHWNDINWMQNTITLMGKKKERSVPMVKLLRNSLTTEMQDRIKLKQLILMIWLFTISQLQSPKDKVSFEGNWFFPKCSAHVATYHCYNDSRTRWWFKNCAGDFGSFTDNNYSNLYTYCFWKKEESDWCFTILK